METIENILGMIVLVIFILTIGLFVYTNNFVSITSSYEGEEQKFLYTTHSNSFDTLLLLHDNSSQLSLSELTSLAAFEESEVINNSGVIINITDEYIRYLDQIYGRNNYYVSIKPKVADVSLNFVIDGSSTLQDERERLATELPTLLSKIKTQNYINGEEKIIANVFILGKKEESSESKCTLFDELYNAEITCTLLDHVDLYQRPEVVEGIETTDFNNYKIEYNIEAPYGSRESQVHSVRGDGNIKDYYEADWGNGVAYVSALSKDTARLVLIFPMSDELSTSSISEACFTPTLLGKNKNEGFREQKVCDFCKKSCEDPNSPSIVRAYETIENGALVAKDNGHVVYPIFAYDCDYPYNTVTFNGYFDYVFGNGIPSSTACNEDVCGGCSEDLSQNVCFHPECETYILDHMEYLANETSGRVIDLDDLDELIRSVEEGVKTTLNSFEHTIGIKQNRSKFVYQRSLVMDNKLFTDITLEVYYDISDIDQELYDEYLELIESQRLDLQPPIFSITSHSQREVVIDPYVSISGIATDKNGVSDISYFCTYGCSGSGIANGTNPFSIDSLELTLGDNYILFIVQDLSNQSNTLEYELILTYLPPLGGCDDIHVHCIGEGYEFESIALALANGSGGDEFRIYEGEYYVDEIHYIKPNLAGTAGRPTTFIGIGDVVLDGSGLQRNNGNAVFFLDGFYDSDTDTMTKNKYLHFENLEFKNSGYRDFRVDESTHVTFKNIRSFGAYQNSIFSSFSSHITIEDSYFDTTYGEHCVYLSNSGDYYTIRNNIFKNCDKSGFQINADPDATYCRGFTFGPDEPFCDGVSEHAIFENNKIYGASGRGGAGVNLASVRHSLFQNNIIFENFAGGIVAWDGGYGIEYGSDNNTFRHNTIYFKANEGRSAFQVVKGSDQNKIYNNILLSGKDIGKEYGAIEFDSTTIDTQSLITNNIYYRNGNSHVITNKEVQEFTLAEFNAISEYEDNSTSLTTLNGLFESLLDNTFVLLETSPALDAGIPNSLYYDHSGNSRPRDLGYDIGALEKSLSKSYPISPTCDEIIITDHPLSTIITVGPENASNLVSIINNAEPYTTIYLKDGFYDIQHQGNILIESEHITIRSESGNRDSVIIDSNYKVYGFRVAADDFTLADLTIKRFAYHPIHIQGRDNARLHNIAVFDGGEQFVKINSHPYDGVREFSDNGTVSCSHFELTPSGSANVRASIGPGSCYTGGIDMHAGWNWKFHDSVYKDIYCRNRPGLAEHAIHLWRNGKDNIIERNILINNGRSIGLGLYPGNGRRDFLPGDLDGTTYTKAEVEHVGGVIRNNIIYTNIGKKAESGISLEGAYESQVYHNTIYMIGSNRVPIDSVYESTKKNTIMNNLYYENHQWQEGINFRNQAELEKNTVENNIFIDDTSIFKDFSNLNFELSSSASNSIDQGIFTGTTHDFNNFQRDQIPDVGAYEYGSEKEEITPPPVIPEEPPEDDQNGDTTTLQLCREITTIEDNKNPIKEIFISPQGDDTNGDGSQTNPYKTFSKASLELTAGSALRLLPGTYSNMAWFSFLDLVGTQENPIWIGGYDSENKPVISGGLEPIKIEKFNYLILHDMILKNNVRNAINLEDGSQYANETAASHVLIRDVTVENLVKYGSETTSNCVKISGVRNFAIINSKFKDCSSSSPSGSTAIDGVGVHNGLIYNNSFDNMPLVGVQFKGGSENIEVIGNIFNGFGDRAIQAGGYTGDSFFRKPLSTTKPNFEARNISILGNFFENIDTPLSFTGSVDVTVEYNTFVDFNNYLARIVKEKQSDSTYTFYDTQNGTIKHNIVYFDSSIYSILNIGSNTNSSSFLFENNLWYNYNNPSQTISKLNGIESREVNGIYANDPKFISASSNNYYLESSSPAYKSSTGISRDFMCHTDTPNIGAFQ
mgnify:CR=1 FL=1